jgi:hypothetical protein
VALFVPYHETERGRPYERTNKQPIFAETASAVMKN